MEGKKNKIDFKNETFAPAGGLKFMKQEHRLAISRAHSRNSWRARQYPDLVAALLQIRSELSAWDGGMNGPSRAYAIVFKILAELKDPLRREAVKEQGE